MARPPVIRPDRGLFAETIVGVIVGADVEARIFGILQRLAFLELLQPLHGQIAHLEGTLANLACWTSPSFSCAYLHIWRVSAPIRKTEVLRFDPVLVRIELAWRIGIVRYSLG